MSVTSTILTFQQLASSKSTLFTTQMEVTWNPWTKVTLKLKTNPQTKRLNGKKTLKKTNPFPALSRNILIGRLTGEGTYPTPKPWKKTHHLTKFLFVAHPVPLNAHVPLAVPHRAFQVRRPVADVAKLIRGEFLPWIRYQNESSSTEP